jgi:hypothetical protein
MKIYRQATCREYIFWIKLMILLYWLDLIIAIPGKLDSTRETIPFLLSWAWLWKIPGIDGQTFTGLSTGITISGEIHGDPKKN